MKNFNTTKISKAILLWQQGLLTKTEAERIIILHHNKSKEAKK